MAGGGASPSSLGQGRTGFSLCPQGGVGWLQESHMASGSALPLLSSCWVPAALGEDTTSSGPGNWNTLPASTLHVPSLCGPAPA